MTALGVSKQFQKMKHFSPHVCCWRLSQIQADITALGYLYHTENINKIPPFSLLIAGGTIHVSLQFSAALLQELLTW